MNFWDLCVACWNALGRLCSACWCVIAHMLRLTYRYWYIVITLIILALAGGYYISRYENTTFRVNAIVKRKEYIFCDELPKIVDDW